MSEMFGVFYVSFLISYGTGFNTILSIFIASMLYGFNTILTISQWQLKMETMLFCSVWVFVVWVCV